MKEIVLPLVKQFTELKKENKILLEKYEKVLIELVKLKKEKNYGK